MQMIFFSKLCVFQRRCAWGVISQKYLQKWKSQWIFIKHSKSLNSTCTTAYSVEESEWVWLNSVNIFLNKVFWANYEVHVLVWEIKRIFQIIFVTVRVLEMMIGGCLMSNVKCIFWTITCQCNMFTLLCTRL